MHSVKGGRSSVSWSIPGDFPDTSTEAFDQKYMSQLFDLGFKLGKSGSKWKKTPPRMGNAS
jgi:hypothetical protein